MLALEEQSLKERQPTGQKGPAVGMAGCQEVLGGARTLEPSQLPGPGLGRGSVSGEDKSWWASQGGPVGPEVGTGTSESHPYGGGPTSDSQLKPEAAST